MEFALTNVKSIAIPEGNVKSISVGDVEIWEKESAPADKYSWKAVFASVRAGTYATDYAIGDLIPINLGTEGIVDMQIAGFDVDDRADGNGKAHITWISKNLLKTSHRMNPSIYDSPGDWEKSEMRTYLKETIKPLIPSNVRSAIIEVTKTQTAYNSDRSSFTQTTQDDIWLPTWKEIRGSSSKYETLFPHDRSLIKYKVGMSSESNWWTREPSDNYNFWHVIKGNAGTSSPIAQNGVVLCFCI